MGIGTLRRRHSAAEVEANAPAPAAPVSAPDIDVERLRADVAKLTEKLGKAGEHVALWKRRALELGYTDQPSENGPENGGQAAPEQPEQPPAPPAEVTPDQSDDPIAQARADDMPLKSAKTAEWVDYAERYPLDPPLDLTARPGLRDEIVAAYVTE